MSRIVLIWTLVWATAVTILASDVDNPSYNETANIESREQPSKILSRKKRFLIFPDGSSFQLVFCAQNQGYLQIGDIVWFGNTAALAWELPSDPELFNILKSEARPYGDIKRQDTKHITYLDEDGKVLSKVPYHKRPIVNPAFAKRSIEGETPENNNDLKLWSVKEMHDKELNRNHFQDLKQDRIQFHRDTRKDLYDRLEKVFQGLGWNGRECVLRMLCAAAKGSDVQGTFLQEIVKATFTLPRGRGFDSEEYDVAHGSADCIKMYPVCNISDM